MQTVIKHRDGRGIVVGPKFDPSPEYIEAMKEIIKQENHVLMIELDLKNKPMTERVRKRYRR